MLDVQDGFRAGEHLFPWGTRLGEVATALGQRLEQPAQRRYQRAIWACAPTYGFDTISVEFTTHGFDRPVTALCYEIAAPADGSLPDPEIWTEAVSAILGEPQEARLYDISDHPNPSGGVRYGASWSLAGHSFAISAYGAPRDVKLGLSAGCLWLNWATMPAAQPFLDEWRVRAADLAVLAPTHSGIVSFFLEAPQRAAYGYVDGGVEREAHYALMHPELLPTPKPIADALGPKGIAFWRTGDYSSWCASTKWDSVLFQLGQPVTVDWYDVLPAKGGGFSEIQIEDWRVRDYTGSRAVKDAVSALKTIPGVTVRYVQDHDC